MTIYAITTSWGETVHFAADLTQAAAPICNVDDETFEVGSSTQYQTADARHDAAKAARLYVGLLGRDWYGDPESDPESDADDDTQIAAAIASVEPIE